MAGGIAHHFNNLLGIVIGNMELALDGLPPHKEKLRSCLGEAMKASHRAAEISQFMLAYIGQTTRKTEALDLAEAVREALALLTASIPKNVHIKTDLPSDGPTILADGVHVRQILTNLVSNSVEAIGGKEGDICVTIGVMAEGEIRSSRVFPLDWDPKTGDYVCLSVSDTGCGVEPAIQEKIFDPFFSTKFTGRGLGLSVALGLVRAQGGAISVESSSGQGTTFRLFFPPKAEEISPRSEEETVGLELEDTAGLVLVVDDEPMLRNMAQAQVERLGYEVITARDGLDAVEKFALRKDEFCLVLLDLTMPRMGGWETLAALRALRS